MIRTFMIAAAAIAMSAPAAFAQDIAIDQDSGVVVQGQPPNAYVITINTSGKDESTIRAEITDAAWTACQRAPSTSNFADNHVDAMESCVTAANDDALAQMHQVLAARRLGGYYAEND
jgi:hypothetical protein